MKRRAIQQLTLLVATAIALIGVTTPASASERYPEVNATTAWLTAYPTPGLAAACTSRRVTLPSGPYEWDARYTAIPAWDFRIENFRRITLGAGTYTWTDCLKPSYGVYIHTSTLNPDNPAWQTATVDRIFEMFLWTDSGQMMYGSMLTAVSS
ncbi:hypothetical protein OG555_24480 [Kribbella sp. NBC_01484]|uniref:hypothetical protein n=1 Tax=Kribbella sp. NBC_01484 TaxID=2903579 RepID=UPI002E318085|nr:hypothetical protein [Kribbella sp. NBC_01484]